MFVPVNCNFADMNNAAMWVNFCCEESRFYFPTFVFASFSVPDQLTIGCRGIATQLCLCPSSPWREREVTNSCKSVSQRAHFHTHP